MPDNTLIAKKSTDYFYLLRIFAILGVVMCHTAARYWNSFDESTVEWKIISVFDSVSRWGSMNFLMISGALFLSPDRNITPKKIFTKSIPKIIVAYLIWALVFAIYECHGDISKKEILTRFVEGEYHLWYLNMLFALYLATPVLRKITENREIAKYFLILSFIFTFVIPAILNLIWAFDQKKIIDFSFYTIFNTAKKKMYFNFAVGYTFYYVLGYYLYSFDISLKEEIASYVLGVLGFASTILLMIKIGDADDPYDLYSKFSINVCFEVISVFVLFKQRLSKLLTKEKTVKLIKKISALTFGVYLMHPLIINILYYSFGLDATKYNLLFSIPLVFALTSVFSFSFTWILKKIPVIKNWAV